MNSTQLHYLHAMGISAWKLRGISRSDTAETTPDYTTPLKAVSAPMMAGSGPKASDDTPNTLAALQQRVANCTACELHCTRKQTVFGVGDPNARLLIVGEAPGAQEDAQGEPFVGRAGGLLNEMLAAIGLQRENIYIANILKCRPPNNRNPSADEIKECTPFLQEQIDLIKPAVMVASGRIAAHHLLNTKESLSRLRGNVYRYGEKQTPLIVTYHPAYLLRTPKDKRKAYQDLLFIKNKL